MRDNALDALRMIAVLFMVMSHTTRLITWDERRAWSVFSLLIEPMTASLFLVLVGASLTHSWLSARTRALGGALTEVEIKVAWFKRQALRALPLWAVSCVFYALEDGPHLPDMLTMSGILATIAYTILAGMLLVSARRPVPLLIAMAVMLSGLHTWLDLRGLRVFALNAGNSPLLPLFLFACLGALGAYVLESGGRRTRALLAAAALLTVAGLIHRYGFAALFSKPLGRYETIRTLVTHPAGRMVERNIPYYNLRPILVPMIVSLTIMLYGGLALLRPVLDRIARWALPLGRRSLDVYILHLALLAVLVETGGKRPLKAAWQGDAVILMMAVLCYAWVTARDRYPRFPLLWKTGNGTGEKDTSA
ncbi:MAG: acyltransferase family protein [Fibrobacteria bacterium]